MLGAQLAAGFRGKGIKLIKVFAKIIWLPAGHLSMCHNGEAMMGLRYLPSILPALGFRDQILTQKRGWGSLVISASLTDGLGAYSLIRILLKEGGEREKS